MRMAIFKTTNQKWYQMLALIPYLKNMTQFYCDRIAFNETAFSSYKQDLIPSVGILKENS
jgi:hypothetical protein